MHDMGRLVAVAVLFGLIIAECAWLIARLGVPAEVAWVMGFVVGTGVGVLIGRNIAALVAAEEGDDDA